jgi:hypothetical protein
MRATCPAHIILLDFTTRTILGKEAVVPLQQKCSSLMEKMPITGVTWSAVRDLRDLEHWESANRSRKKEVQVKETNKKTQKKKDKEKRAPEKSKRRKIC